MKKNAIAANWLSFTGTPLLLFVFMLIGIGCQKTYEKPSQQDQLSALSKSEKSKDIKPHELKDFMQVNLVANTVGYNAAHIDPFLRNAWGLAFLLPNGIPWVADQAGHVATIYDREGNTLRPPVNIPSPGGPVGGNPTGVVFNGSNTDFILSNGGAARFIFVGVDGIISGWNPAAGNNALVIKNNVATSSYTGVTIANNAGANLLYAANFRANRIDVYDHNFTPVSMPFMDPRLPSGYSPFNIQNAGGMLFVMYAKVGSDGRDQAGPGFGFVDIYTPAGTLVRRFASRGALNAPWGMTMAPAGFFNAKDDGDEDADHEDADEDAHHDNGDKDDNDDQAAVLIGNFGNGRINAFNSRGRFLGQLRMHGKPLTIDGLWSLSFPPSTSTIDPNRLYFTAGPNSEMDGLFGYIIKQ